MADFQALALKLINKSGRSITLRKLSLVPADAAKPWEGNTDDPTDLAVKGVFVGPGEAFGQFFSNELGEIVRSGESYFLVAAVALGSELLEDFDSILDGASTWKIDRVETLQPGDVRILHALVVHR